jgi:uncharacterized protein (DUF1501 family)
MHRRLLTQTWGLVHPVRRTTLRQQQSTRRQFLRASALAGAGLALGQFLRLQALAASERPPTAEACILIFLNGGMSHLDTFDPKPDQPAEIRGEFSPLRTAAPGITITDPWPLLALQAHHLAVVRSVGFEGRLGNHSPACYYLLTGVAPEGDDAVLAPPRPTDHPSMGAATAKLRSTPASIPAYVMVPDVLIENVFVTPGPYAGWLGSRYEAFCLKGDPNAPGFAVPGLTRLPDLSEERLEDRRRLLDRVEALRPDLTSTAAGRSLGPFFERAFDLLTGTRSQAALRLEAEPLAVRERYGRDTLGQSCLLARRLVEAGVRFVNVHWPDVGGGKNWDTHANGFRRLRESLIPRTDRALSALVSDLAERGMLATTLVAVLTEFGRAPQIGKTFQNSGGPGGRDHWSSCFSILLAGGGIAGGQVHGSSDAQGAFPRDKPVNPADIVATIYQAFGIDPGATLQDAERRTHRLCAGRPIGDLFHSPT